jgi:uncharacterized protein (DUF427 family)
MAAHITITPARGTWVIRAGDAVIGESRAALELVEGGGRAVIYFPRADLAMAMMDASPTTSSCPWKGKASYWSISTSAGMIRDAAWSYDDPKAEVAAIAGHLAFYPNKVTVEQV